MSPLERIGFPTEAPPSARVGLYRVSPCLDQAGRLLDCVVDYANEVGYGFLSLDAPPPPGTRVSELIPPARLAAFLGEAQRALDTGEIQQSEFEIGTGADERHWVWHEVIPLGSQLVVRSATTADRHAMAEFDELTGLLNSHGLRRRGRQFLEQVPEGRGAILVRLAPRRFYDVRDVLGFEFADAFVRAYAARLCALAVPHRHLAARVGHNQFAVLMQFDGDEEGPGSGVNGLEGLVDTRIEVSGAEVHVVSVLGVARFRRHGERVEDLLRAADMAYSASRRARSRPVTFYNPRLGREAQARITLQKELAGALEREEMRQVFQPICCSGGTILGFEALLRWNNRQLGEVSPVEFIPVAEETGLIVELGRWVFRQAAMQLARMQAAAGPQLFVSVNLSAAQFADVRLADELSRAATAAGVDPASIELEITETVLMHDSGESEHQIHRLRGLGFRLSVDDFGTGYSSLAYLRRFAVDKLKIDRSFIAGLQSGDHSIDIVRAIISLADSLGLPVVAEGIETEVQFEILRRMRCGQFQGFLLGRPMEPDAAHAILAASGQATAPTPG